MKKGGKKTKSAALKTRHGAKSKPKKEIVGIIYIFLHRSQQYTSHGRNSLGSEILSLDVCIHETTHIIKTLNVN